MRSTRLPRHPGKHDFGSTDHPSAAKPAGLRWKDLDPGVALLPHARARDAARGAAAAGASGAVGRDFLGASAALGSLRPSRRWHRAGPVRTRARSGQAGDAQRRDARAFLVEGAARLPGGPAALPAGAWRRPGARDPGELSSGHRRGRNLLARNAGAVPVVSVRKRASVLLASVLADL